MTGFVEASSRRARAGRGASARAVELLLDAYRIKWLCIILNDFQHIGAARRRSPSRAREPNPLRAPTGESYQWSEDRRFGCSNSIATAVGDNAMAYRQFVSLDPQVDQPRLSRARHRTRQGGSRRTRGAMGLRLLGRQPANRLRRLQYDGRWRKVADAMVEVYGIKPGMRVLDVGSGKGFLLHDFHESVAGLEVAGIDISTYGIEHGMESVKSNMPASAPRRACLGPTGTSTSCSRSTRCTTSTSTICSPRYAKSSAWAAAHKYICVEAYRNEREKGEPDVLAAHLPRLPHARGMALDFRADRLYRRSRVHFLRVARACGGSGGSEMHASQRARRACRGGISSARPARDANIASEPVDWPKCVLRDERAAVGAGYTVAARDKLELTSDFAPTFSRWGGCRATN